MRAGNACWPRDRRRQHLDVAGDVTGDVTVVDEHDADGASHDTSGEANADEGADESAQHEDAQADQDCSTE